MRRLVLLSTLSLAFLASHRAQAEGLALSASADASSADASSSAAEGESAARSQALMEPGIFGGLFFPSADHRLFSRTQEAFNSPSPELGGRIVGYPLNWLGLEVEAAGMPSSTETTDSKGGFWAVRGHALGQIPMNSLSLFALVGGGALSAGSEVTGTDADPAIHFGIGAKWWLDDVIGLRLDVRDTLTQKNAAASGTQTHHPEVLLGLSFGVHKPRTQAAPVVAPADADQDGVPDEQDACPALAGPAPSGCPDSDGDGLTDDKDACPQEAGGAPCGCPPRDRDGDRFIDELDDCPDQAGPINGCPDPDPDREGVLGADDRETPPASETLAAPVGAPTN